MKLRVYALLGLLGLLVAAGVAAYQPSPGYMDAEYYTAGGLRLVQGQGFSEMLLWNYLDDPAGLPHPSHGYWMPLTSLLAALGMWVTGSRQFWAARLGFILLAGVIPMLTARLAFSFNKNRQQAVLAGLLAVFPAFYVPFLPVTDAFGPHMLFGTLFLLCVSLPFTAAPQPGRLPIHQGLLPAALGALAGFLHLSRADGLLWLGVAVLVCVFTQDGVAGEPAAPRSRAAQPRWRVRLARLLACGLGYGLVMSAWLWRNYNVFGAWLAPGGSRALWLTDYDELFIFPASLLTFGRWLGSGWQDILGERAWALGLNLQTSLVVQAEVFLLPLILAGLWKLRTHPAVRWGGLAWGLTFLAMTLAFPFAGARGGFFHSGAALQPLFWAVTPAGLEAFLAWGSRRRGWNIVQARGVFRAALVLLAAALTGFIFFSRVYPAAPAGGQPARRTWGQDMERYARLEERLAVLGALPGEVVMVNNPPGYFLSSQRPAIVIPHGDLAALLAAAQRYRAHYLLVELDQVQGVELFAVPGDVPGLRFLESFANVRIYQIVGGSP